MTEETKKAMALIAAELHIQNQISIMAFQGMKPAFSMMSEKPIPKLAEHFKCYIEGDIFSPGLISKFEMQTGT